MLGRGEEGALPALRMDPLTWGSVLGWALLILSWPRTGLAGEELKGRQEVGQQWGRPGLCSELPGARGVLLATWK